MEQYFFLFDVLDTHHFARCVLLLFKLPHLQSGASFVSLAAIAGKPAKAEQKPTTKDF
jgi:hypothetical protein